jgi:hypothetical protein
MLLHDNPDSVLVIGLATGITLSAVAEHAARFVECVELVHSQLEVLRFFEPENRGVARDARVRIVIDDGRAHVRHTPHRYDVIVSDLFQVNSGGTGNLYAREHVRACREKLREGGLLVQWFPLQQMTVRGFRSALRSYTEEFPYVQFWLCDGSPEKPVAAVVASMNPLRLDFDRILDRIGRAAAPTAASVGYDDPYFFLSQCIMQTERLREYAGSAPLNTYDRPVVEYSAARRPFNTGKKIILSLMAAPSPLRLEAERDEDLTLLQEYARAHYRNLLSQLAGSAGRWDRAEEILEETIAVVPRNPDTRRLLGRAKVLRAASLIEQGRRYDASVKLDSARLLGIDDPFVTRLEGLAKEP